MRIYLIAGLAGVGKTTAKEFSKKYGFMTVSIGDIVRQEYNAMSRDESISEFATRVHEDISPKYFARKTVECLEEKNINRNRPDLRGIVVDGVNSILSANVFYEEFDHIFIIWIRSTVEDRLRRLKNRGSEIQTVSDLFHRDLRELNYGLTDLARPIGHDYHITNNNDIDTFKNQLENIFSR